MKTPTPRRFGLHFGVTTLAVTVLAALSGDVTAVVFGTVGVLICLALILRPPRPAPWRPRLLGGRRDLTISTWGATAALIAFVFSRLIGDPLAGAVTFGLTAGFAYGGMVWMQTREL